ncbi:hypothetical protein PYW08_006139 [Mythimna loreyi]|uniref:Uncharacterized protein n=1 Tax=Mythimna loreyi TaxID=667449 RepID=A0ACC2QPC9_9NEOP|nr:hypothetical protein PYW08_006139 [Mythimna loreyi]
MESRVRASPEQLLTLLEYMETHGDLARPLAGSQARLQKSGKKCGQIGSPRQNKALTIRHHARGTGGGPASGQTLSASDERVLAIIGAIAVTGQDSVEELGFTRSINTAQDDPAAQDDPVIQDDSVYLEIIDETPQLTSLPQPSTSQPSNNWIPPSSSYELQPPPLPLVLTQTSAQGREPVAPAPPATRAPAAPSPPAPSPPTPAVPTTPRRRRPPAPARLLFLHLPGVGRV